MLSGAQRRCHWYRPLATHRRRLRRRCRRRRGRRAITSALRVICFHLFESRIFQQRLLEHLFAKTFLLHDALDDLLVFEYAFVFCAFEMRPFAACAQNRYAFHRQAFARHTFARNALVRVAFARYATAERASARYTFSGYTLVRRACDGRLFGLARSLHQHIVLVQFVGEIAHHSYHRCCPFDAWVRHLALLHFLFGHGCCVRRTQLDEPHRFPHAHLMFAQIREHLFLFVEGRRLLCQIGQRFIAG